jgi:hypothetical protein
MVSEVLRRLGRFPRLVTHPDRTLVRFVCMPFELRKYEITAKILHAIHVVYDIAKRREKWGTASAWE